MPQEIERKFLVKGNDWRKLSEGVPYSQGYISTTGKQTVRVRTVGDRGFITIKGPREGISRAEFEYSIPYQDAIEILDTLCDRPLIKKTRYKIPVDDVVWEVDEFAGENEGLVIAEVELLDEQQTIDLPDWIDREVDDPKYFNANLAKHPYSQWQEKQNIM
ncbi:CYTH domain-containing protein [Myxosarcina sp. GI1]|uniref:CYTH domain-containing protein n=1 Tax=Myxosarcina sp. GI1 TaxID=1541065 RepID=UPI00055E8169|nr:CYTH domain-containing protein [Myxosarcina sp. GI1]